MVNNNKSYNTSAARKTNNPHWFLLATIFLVPRLIRMLYPKVWIEDPFYLYASYLIRNGLFPFRDFGHTQLPGAEYLLSLFYMLFGSSYRVAEIVTQATVYATTWIIYLIGRRLHNRITATGAALIFSFSSLLFRYHVYEREIFILFLLTLVVYLLLKWQKLGFNRAAAIGILLALCVFFKMTALLQTASVILFVILVKKDVSGALKLAFSIIFFTFLVLIGAAALNTGNFFNQAVLYHFVKGESFSSRFSVLTMPARSLDVTLALGVFGVFFWKKRLFPGMWLPILLFLPEWFFFSCISPNAWPHNYIPFLLLLSLSGGTFIYAIYEMLREKKEILRPFVFIVLLAFSLISFFPFRNLNWIMGSVYGFGYILRRDIKELSGYIKTHTDKKDFLLIPQYIASESDRMTVISDRIEATSVFRWIEEKRAEKYTIKEIKEMAKGKSFQEMQSQSVHLGWDKVMVLLNEKKIKFVVLDFVPGEIVPCSTKYLTACGYIPIKRYGWYVVWAPR